MGGGAVMTDLESVGDPAGAGKAGRVTGVGPAAPAAAGTEEI